MNKIIKTFIIPFFIAGLCYTIGRFTLNTFFWGTITGMVVFALVSIIKVLNKD